jgi:alpha-tubulin suppressor-like RCC1 family protein
VRAIVVKHQDAFPQRVVSRVLEKGHWRHEYGPLGNGSVPLHDWCSTEHLFPQPSAQAIVAGQYFSCALVGKGIVKCWGDNSSGELGVDSTKSSETPVTVVSSKFNGPLTGVTALSGGGSLTVVAGGSAITNGDQHACALLRDSTVMCWGSGSDGQLGAPDYLGENTSDPVAVEGLRDVTAISAKERHTCALLRDGSVECWGYDASQQRDGDPSIPVPVAGLSGATAITTGSGFSCALLKDGTVQCWGTSDSGGLGTAAESSETPVTIAGLSGVTAISTGYVHSCAVISDGTVECWGQNNDGQLGFGDLADGFDYTPRYSPAPVIVTGLSGVTAIAAGENHTCALRSDGTVECWGSNSSGQLGPSGPTGRVDSTTTPVPVPGLRDVTAIAVGTGSSCALLKDRTVKCWGTANTSGSYLAVKPTVIHGL